MGHPTQSSFTSKGSAKAFFEAHEMNVLEDVLNDCADELELAGLIHPLDRDYDLIRLTLAATLLSLAAAGESDPTQLRIAALRVVAVSPAPV